MVAPFGSMGDAFEFRPTRGSFEVNPPFDPGFVARLVAHLEALGEYAGFSRRQRDRDEVRALRALAKLDLLPRKSIPQLGSRGFSKEAHED